MTYVTLPCPLSSACHLGDPHPHQQHKETRASTESRRQSSAWQLSSGPAAGSQQLYLLYPGHTLHTPPSHCSCLLQDAPPQRLVCFMFVTCRYQVLKYRCFEDLCSSERRKPTLDFNEHMHSNIYFTLLKFFLSTQKGTLFSSTWYLTHALVDICVYMSR